MKRKGWPRCPTCVVLRREVCFFFFFLLHTGINIFSRHVLCITPIRSVPERDMQRYSDLVEKKPIIRTCSLRPSRPFKSLHPSELPLLSVSLLSYPPSSFFFFFFPAKQSMMNVGLVVFLPSPSASSHHSSCVLPPLHLASDT